jgi:hypothetical protein
MSTLIDLRENVPRGKKAAEKLEDFYDLREKHASGAEAPIDSNGSVPGIKSPAYRPNESFRGLESPLSMGCLRNG